MKLQQKEIDGAIKEAIQATLPKKDGYHDKLMFNFAYQLKKIPELTKAPAKDIKPFVKKWYKRAKPYLDKSFDDIWSNCNFAWSRIKYQKGDDMLAKAAKAAQKIKDIPLESNQYDSEEGRLLVRLCYQLQQLQGEKPFFLSCRSAAGILGIDNYKAVRMLKMLETDEIIELVEKHKGSKANRYRYKGCV